MSCKMNSQNEMEFSRVKNTSDDYNPIPIFTSKSLVSWNVLLFMYVEEDVFATVHPGNHYISTETGIGRVTLPNVM